LAAEVVEMARATEAHRLRRLGQPAEVLAAGLEAILARDPAAFRADDPVCAGAAGIEAQRTGFWLDRYRAPHEEDRNWQDFIDQAGMTWGIFRDLGCFPGHPRRFADNAALQAWVISARDRKLPGAPEIPCAQAFRMLDQVATPEALAGSRSWPGGEATFAWSALATYYGGPVFQLCVDERR
jgi:hypothetical protein